MENRKKAMFIDMRDETAAADQRLEDQFPNSFKQKLKSIFETSGLYQNHRVEGPKDYSARLFELYRKEGVRAQLSGMMSAPPVHLRVPDIELDCVKCRSRKLFSCEAVDAMYRQESSESEQLFNLTYKCHECDRMHIGFLLRRVGLKLQLTGRSIAYRPLVSAAWTNATRTIAEDALAAVGEGDISAAYYHLRTAIEHDMKERVRIPLTDKIEGNELCKQYNDTVDGVLKERFPSFAELYSKLSAGMHSREVSTEDFRQLFADVEKHLNARKMLDESPAKAS